MGDRGKRFRSQRMDKDGDDKYQKRRISNKEASGDGELVVYRILCPDGFIGSVIGKSGKVINSIRQESNARVKVLDSFPGTNDRVITIYCYVKDRDEEVDEDDMRPLCPAQDALLKVHAAIMNAVATIDESDNKGKEDAHILVPSSQVANIIGKSGSVIKKTEKQDKSNDQGYSKGSQRSFPFMCNEL